MIFSGSAVQDDSTYFENKLTRAREKLKEFHAIARFVDNFNLATRSNHTENVLLNLTGAANSEYDHKLKLIDSTLEKLSIGLSESKKNHLVYRLKSFDTYHRASMSEIEFLIELQQNPNIAQIEYENEWLGNHDFNFKVDKEEFNIEHTSLGKSIIQCILEETFNQASKKILQKIPAKTLLMLSVDTSKILKKNNNNLEEAMSIIINDYARLEKILLIDLQGSCRIDNNLGDHNKSLYEVKEVFEYYDEFGQRLVKLLDDQEGIVYLKTTKIGEIANSSITDFIVGPAKFGIVTINSQCIWPSRAESLRKDSLVRQFEKAIEQKIQKGQLHQKTNPLLAFRFEDSIFMNYSSDEDIWWEENFNELKEIIESVFRKTNNNEILGILLYENTIKKSKFVQNPNLKVVDKILNKIRLLRN